MIESLQNEKVKYLTKLLTDNRFRKKEKVFTVEGIQENERAGRYNFEPVNYFICESIFSGQLPLKYESISENIYEKVAYRGSSEGIIGIYNSKENNLTEFQPSKNASVIVIESVEKPGNLGAIIRSCEAFGIEALIITDPKVDIYNPNVIRSSVGCLFGMTIFQSGNDETLNFLKKSSFQILTTNMHNSAEEISKKDLKLKSALIFGTEHSGLSDFWTNKGENIIIPMSGSIDSLNLSNAVAISCYEILRQKK
ncbi:TrmH family RNA methyltransferase [Halpernia frigidisoli]|uniref:RNA methyltransferase, TrmH family n=1 Tax=Halpernia frigidisoli TaxID=1125876 RepID=A0A1I3J7L1_9FLAO|nr:TrmH family RNA methyltransferase [Halpernia frigidisoli]SFI56304.1 RNA methyltransferase, TrmH family [Halpernia frigidisoli]